MVKKGPLDKGSSAEEGLADYFRAAGFFVVRGLPFRHEGKDLTDADVWLYERGSGLGRRRFIVDAKNKKSPRVVERLFWTSGFLRAVGVDGGFVATTGASDATRRVARRLGITLFDLQVIGRGSRLENLQDPDRLSKEELDSLLKEADRKHETKSWWSHRDEVLAALLTRFGASSANTALRAAHVYLDEALKRAPDSAYRELGLRLFFLSLSAAAAALDFVAAQIAFHPPEQRRQELEDAVRYGNEPDETKSRLKLAIDLVRSFLPNGAVVGNQLRERILTAFDEVPADIIAEVVGKMAWKGQLFEAARELDVAAYQRAFPSFESLSVSARSFIGAVLDFLGVDRTVLVAASGLAGQHPTNELKSLASEAEFPKSLFDTE